MRVPAREGLVQRGDEGLCSLLKGPPDVVRVEGNAVVSCVWLQVVIGTTIGENVVQILFRG